MTDPFDKGCKCTDIEGSGPDTSAGFGTSLTVALCTYNHKPRLEITLRGLAQLSQTSEPWEFLVVDNGSTDGTSELLAATEWHPAHVPVRVVREERLGLSNARNRAITEARGEYIVFIDDDETPDPDWLTAYERAILAQRPDALGGRIQVMFVDGDRPPWLQDELLGFLGRLDHGDVARQLTDTNTPIFGGNFAFRKETFAKIGLFDAELGRMGAANVGGEDTDIYRRMIDMGSKVWWVPEAVIHHRIQGGKLCRRYFLDLHYRQGYAEGLRKRGNASRFPPAYLFPQLGRAIKSALAQRLREGGNTSLRKEMNIAHFLGFLVGWASRPDK